MPVTVELSQSESLNQEDDDVPSLSQLQEWANAACLEDSNAIASVQILSAEEMQALNRDFSGKDKPTNVLSFPMQLPEHVEIDLLGDLALCAEIINTEAKQQNKSKDAHWAHMVVHGMLHLQGYDHINDDEAVEMETLETQILKKIGINNPYETDLLNPTNNI